MELTATEATTVNAALIVAEAPPELATVMSRAPTDAPLAIVSVAVSCVAELTDTLLADTPVPLRLTEVPAATRLPVMVTGTVAPGTPWLGVTDVIAIAGAVTEKAPGSVPFPPFGFVTVRSRVPIAAPAATVRVAVI